MKILLLTQWFEPEPTFKGLLFAKELASRGHQVEVLTGFPNYPGGKLYPGYKIRPWLREVVDGISVTRVALYPSHSKSGIGRALNYLSFAASAAILGTVLVNKPDIIYVYCPPVTVGLAAIALKFLRRVPFVIDIQDLWPDTVEASGMLTNSAALSILGTLCNFIYRQARHIVVLSPGFRQRLVFRGVPTDKVDVIYNWCDEAALRQTSQSPQLRQELGIPDGFVVMFAGTMGTAQGLDAVLDAAAIAATASPNIHFVFVGGGVDRARLEARAAALGLANVTFLPLQPMSAMGGILALADVLLVHLRDHELFTITIPSKAQAYMAVGKPILMAVRGDSCTLMNDSGAGLVCEPENPQAIAGALAHLSAMPPSELAALGTAGRRYYDQKISLSAGVSRFEAIFARLCGRTVEASRRP